MTAGSIILLLIGLILLGVLIYLVIKLIRTIRGRKHALVDKYGYMPSHTELYFEEYFPSLISEWDIVTKPKIQRWKEGISKKLKSIGNDIEEVVGYRKDIDKRLDKLEKEVVTLEKK